MKPLRARHGEEPRVSMEENIRLEMAEAEEKAWKALAGYKFLMFGYWAASWVRLNRLGKTKQPSPWRKLVEAARERQGTERQELEGQSEDEGER